MAAQRARRLFRQHCFQFALLKTLDHNHIADTGLQPMVDDSLIFRRAHPSHSVLGAWKLNKHRAGEVKLALQNCRFFINAQHGAAKRFKHFQKMFLIAAIAFAVVNFKTGNNIYGHGNLLISSTLRRNVVLSKRFLIPCGYRAVFSMAFMCVSCYRAPHEFHAGVAELVDAPDLGSGTERCGGSSPSARTKHSPPRAWIRGRK